MLIPSPLQQPNLHLWPFFDSFSLFTLSSLLLMAADKAAISLEEIKNETVDLVCSLSTIYLQVFLLQNPLIFFYFSVSASFHYPFPFTLAEKSWDFSIIIAKCSTCTPFFPLTVLIHSIFFIFYGLIYIYIYKVLKTLVKFSFQNLQPLSPYIFFFSYSSINI